MYVLGWLSVYEEVAMASMFLAAKLQEKVRHVADVAIAFGLLESRYKGTPQAPIARFSNVNFVLIIGRNTMS